MYYAFELSFRYRNFLMTTMIFQEGAEQGEPAVHGGRAGGAGGDGEPSPAAGAVARAGHVRLAQERLPRRAARLARQGEHRIPQPEALQGTYINTVMPKLGDHIRK